MSTKLPIGDTINEAFQFGLHRWGSVLRFGWLPIVVSMVVVVATALLIFDFSAFPAHDAEPVSSEELGDILRFPAPFAMMLGLAAYVLVFFLFSGVLASIYRLAALGEDRRGIFQLRMDGPAKRVFFAFVILALINLVIWVVALGAGFSISGTSSSEFVESVNHLMTLAATAEPGGSINISDSESYMPLYKVCGYSALIAAVLMFYINIKLVPFAAGSAAENRLWLIGSFAKTTGHFWSILGLMILLFLLMIVIAIIFQIIVVIIQLLAMMLLAQGSALAIIGAVLFLALVPAMIWYMAFTYALQFGLQGIIYRRLKTGA